MCPGAGAVVTPDPRIIPLGPGERGARQIGAVAATADRLGRARAAPAFRTGVVANGTNWGPLGAGYGGSEYLVDGIWRHVRGVQANTVLAVPSGANASILTVPDPPDELLIFEKVAYIGGTGFSMYLLVLQTDGQLVISTEINAAFGVGMNLPVGSWMNVTGISWRAAG